MKTRKKKTTEKLSEPEIEELLQRASLHLTPEDFVTRYEDSNEDDILQDLELD